MRRWVVWREALLAALPALMAAALLTLAARPAYDTVVRRSSGWSPYAYQGLAQDVQAYQVALLDPEASAAERQLRRDIVLSSLNAPGQFSLLPVVETYGEARLSHIRALLRRGTPGSAAAAAREAVMLNAQASSLTHDTQAQALEVLTFLRWVLVVAAALTGLLSMLLTARALLRWRAERERQAHREARQREALDFASHELRRPLQSLLLASDLLRQAETPEQRAHLLTLIEDSAGQIASRADLSHLQDLYLDAVLDVTQLDLRSLVERMEAPRVSVEVPAQPLVWLVDAARLRQVIENLVENALKYTGGPVQVRLAQVDGRPEITVQDAGPGIPPALRERLFWPFERGQGHAAGGQGLGLTLVRRLVRAHRGEVTLEDAPCGGTLVRVTLGGPRGGSGEA
ncbi:Histidine kinase-, DNA gyrase B-, and HSP90-like ATPase [Deinococcus hopiensis KR-140]|uniref:histidine kinase n=1 Tax=Deinococcus hopiensis KR-140 TaxID=695939 RepID=A0A1W1VC94_9DEIO|nr:Histidine kinase-, DNA gyrase B-, and HSP90-like ATPase [Deinococcus hopiensis KR-140]